MKSINLKKNNFTCDETLSICILKALKLWVREGALGGTQNVQFY
jgi:hypothetical protein